MTLIGEKMFGIRLKDFDLDDPTQGIENYEIDPCMDEASFSRKVLELSEKITEKAMNIYEDKKFELIRCRCYYSKELQAASLVNSKEFKLKSGIFLDHLDIAVNPFGLLFARKLAHAPNMGIARYIELQSADEISEGDLHYFIAEYFGKKNVKKILEHILKKFKELKADDFKNFG